MSRALVFALALALTGCGDAYPSRVPRAEIRNTGDGGPFITLREASLESYGWRCDKPTTAWLVAGCCAITTNPRLVGRSPAECPATLTLASCSAEPTISGSEVLRACGLLRASPLAVFPRPRIANTGLTLATEPAARGQTLRVTDGLTTLRAVVGSFSREQLVLRLLDPPPPPDRYATWVVLTDAGLLAGVTVAPPERDHDLVALRAGAIEEAVEACQPVRLSSECEPLPTVALGQRRVPAWAALGAVLGLVALLTALILLRVMRRRVRMRRVRRGGAA